MRTISTRKFLFVTPIVVSVLGASVVLAHGRLRAPAPPPLAGLVAAYGFNEGAGTTATDVSGNGLNGAVNAATWTASGKNGGALVFNGASSYVDLGNPALLQLTGSMTLEAWVNASANPGDDGQIIAKSNGPGWQFKTSPDTGPHTFGIGLSQNASGDSIQRYSNTVRALNTWYHVAGVYDAAAATLTMYVNGSLDNGVARGVVPNAQFNSPSNVNIGRRVDGYYFAGIIDDVRIYNRVLSQAEIQSDMSTPVGGTPLPPDTTPPQVSMTAPANGAAVTGTVNLTALASDNVGISGVQFKVDGANVGTEARSEPYTLPWDSSTTFTGTHAITAVARDFAGNTTTSAAVSVSVTNQGPVQTGQFSAVMPWSFVSVNIHLMPSGKLLAYDGQEIGGNTYVWDPGPNTFVNLVSARNLFCSAGIQLPDGRIFVVGGHVTAHWGLKISQVFNPVTNQWVATPDMTDPRWYPTATALPDGRILVLAGESTCDQCNVTIPQIYAPATSTWSSLSAASFDFPYYPHAFVLPDGRIFVAATTREPIVSQVLNIGQQTWTSVDSTHKFDGGSSVMYRPGKILKTGRSVDPDGPVLNSTATAYVIDMNQPTPAWRQIASMQSARTYHSTTLLPDGTVLVTGGGNTTDAVGLAGAVKKVELWNPATETWTTLATMQTPRLYHSNAILLPDARVLISGGGRFHGGNDPEDQENAEIYSPPYLFKGARPVIASAPTQLIYGQNFTVTTPDAARIAGVSLMHLGAATHSINMGQSYLPLTFTQGTGTLTVTAPASANLSVPGPYMLFLVDTNGVPSVAAMTRLPAPNEDTQPPTAPTGLTATAGTASISLSWTASTDDTGVASYNIHRSTTPNFTVSAANKIGSSPTTTYTDTSIVTAGTYYYRITAQDAKGNVSAPSDDAFAAGIPDTTPPAVAVTSPSGGSTINAIVTINATASDNVIVAGVQFLLDGASLGTEVTTAPYTVSWNTASTPNGPHTLSARARDGAGNQRLAANVAVTVSNTAPTGLLAAYSFGEGSGTVALDVSGHGLNGTINGATWGTGKYGGGLSFNGTSGYVDLGNPAALQLTGSMTLEAWINATANPADDGQIIAKSDGVGWQFKTSPDTGPHTFALGVSPNGSTITQRYSTTSRALNVWYHVAGVYDAAGQTIAVYVDGAPANGTLAGAVGASQFNQDVNVNIGRRAGSPFYFKGLIDEVRIYGRALSQAEVQLDMSTPLDGSAPADTVPPTVSLTAPAAGNVSGTLNVTASASDNVAMAGVQFLLDGNPLGAEVAGAGPNYSISWNSTTVANGPHTLAARGRDTSNNTATTPNVSVTVNNADTTLPTVSMTAPTAGATVAGTFSVRASASDNIAMAGVQFLLDGNPLGAELTGAGPTYTLSWNSTTVGDGLHTLAARARDTSNNLATSAGVSFTVTNTDTTPPTISWTSPANGVTVSGTINLTASASDNTGIAGVQFFVDGNPISTEVTGAGPSYVRSWVTTSVANGPHTLTARARDAANNMTTTSPAVSVTVSNDTTPPTVGLTAPAAGATVSGSITIAASATDNVAMAGVQFLLDGANLGAEVLGAGPTYSFTWNTGTVVNGAHTLSARGRDSAGNTAVATSISVTVSNAVPSGLAAAYAFNAGSGTTTVDSSGSGVTGTLSGATWTTAGKNGNALSFNGTSAYVDLGNPTILKGTGSMTWEVWVKAGATPADDGLILSKSNNASGWQFKTSPDTGAHRFAIALGADGDFVQRNSTTIRALNTWYHVAAVYNATARTLDIYVNGQLDNGILSGTIPAALTVPNINVNIGRRVDGYHFNGVIDDVRVYNRALSAAEIQTDMNTPVALTPPAPLPEPLALSMVTPVKMEWAEKKK